MLVPVLATTMQPGQLPRRLGGSEGCGVAPVLGPPPGFFQESRQGCVSLRRGTFGYADAERCPRAEDQLLPPSFACGLLLWLLTRSALNSLCVSLSLPLSSPPLNPQAVKPFGSVARGF